MLKKTTSFLNLTILGLLILVFEHIGEHQFFGFLYPWIGLILISFIICFSLTMPFFFKKPTGLYTLLIGIIFILIQFITSTPENFKSTVVFIALIVIVQIVVKNSDPYKLRNFLRIIIYCCLINFIYAVYTLIFTEIEMTTTFRIGGLDQAPVLFGYNMLLGFWLVLINSITQNNPNKSPTKLDISLAIVFLIGIFLSKSAGALFGLIMGIVTITFCYGKFSNLLILKIILFLIFLIFGFLMIYIFQSSFFDDYLGFNRYFGKINEIKNLFSGQLTNPDSRFLLWSSMLKAYVDHVNVLNLLFGAGQGAGTTLTGRGVHSDHLKLLFDHGILGLCIYYLKLLNCIKLIREFNIFLVGFIVSVLASGIFYVNFGSINNSFSCILVLIVLSNYQKHITFRN